MFQQGFYGMWHCHVHLDVLELAERYLRLADHQNLMCRLTSDSECISRVSMGADDWVNGLLQTSPIAPTTSNSRCSVITHLAFQGGSSPEGSLQ